MKSITFFISSFICFHILCQPQNIHFEHLNIAQGGLSHNGISLIHQDKNGFIWIGNGSGLSRYDGYKLREFKSDPRIENSLINEVSSCLFEDSKGVFWLGTENGFTRFDTRRNSFKKTMIFTFKNKLYNFGPVSHILQDSKDNIWLFQQSGLIKYNPNSESFVSYPITNNTLLHVVRDSDSMFWCATAKGLYRFDPGVPDPKYENIISVNGLNLVAIGTDNEIYGAVKNQILKYDAIQKTISLITIPSTVLNFEKINCISEIREKIWIGTNKGLLVNTQGSTQLYNHNDFDAGSLSSNVVTQILEDNNGLVWIGTQNGGINILDYNRLRFNSLQNDSKLINATNGKDIYGVFEDSFHKIWVGTLDKGAMVYDPNISKLIGLPIASSDMPGLFDKMCGPICEPLPGVIWLGSWSLGITEISQSQKGNYQYKWIRNDTKDSGSLRGWSIRSILKSKHTGDIWVASMDAGLEKYDIKQKRFLHLDDAVLESFKGMSKKVWTLFEDHYGNIWAGTQDQGVYCLDIKNKKLTNYNFESNNKKSLSSISVRSIFETIDGTIWIGHSGAGLDMLNTKNRRNYKLQLKKRLV